MFVSDETTELPEGCPYPLDNDDPADVEPDEVTVKVARVTPVFVFGGDVALLTYPLERAVEYPKDTDVASVADEPELVETRL
jgi:hypothetical protein